MKRYYSIPSDTINSVTIYDMIKEAQDHNVDKIVLLNETEWEFPLANELYEITKKYGIELIVVFGSFASEVHDNYKCTNIFWPTHFIPHTRRLLITGQVEEFINPTLNPNDFIYPFISLNNISHWHRSVFIDEMQKENLIDKGVVSWVKHESSGNHYPFKYFDNRQILLDDDFVNKLDSFLIPKEYNQSLFHVITESTCMTTFITEKTCIPIYLKKPFFVLANAQWTQQFQELGFVLYDEIIDYTYHDVEDLHERTELFVKNIHNLLDLDLAETYYKLLPKIEHNYNRALEICNDHSLIPDIIKERVNSISRPVKPVDHTYFHYLNKEY